MCECKAQHEYNILKIGTNDTKYGMRKWYYLQLARWLAKSELASKRAREREVEKKSCRMWKERQDTKAIYYDTNSNSVAISQEITKRKKRKNIHLKKKKKQDLNMNTVRTQTYTHAHTHICDVCNTCS